MTILEQEALNRSNYLLRQMANVTLRDVFAVAALSGLSSMDVPSGKIANKAYQIADAMLRAREKGENE